MNLPTTGKAGEVLTVSQIADSITTQLGHTQWISSNKIVISSLEPQIRLGKMSDFLDKIDVWYNKDSGKLIFVPNDFLQSQLDTIEF